MTVEQPTCAGCGYPVHMNEHAPDCRAQGEAKSSEVEAYASISAIMQERFPQQPTEIEGREVHEVKTDDYDTVNAETPVSSGQFFGCTAVLILGPEQTLFAHMTANNRLGVQGMQLEAGMPIDRSGNKEAQQRMLRDAVARGMNLAECRYVIVAEPGNVHRPEEGVPKKYSIEDTQEGWNALRDTMAEEGLTEGVTVPSSVSDFTFLYDPESKCIFVTGRPNEYTAGGVLRDVPNTELETLQIALDGTLLQGRAVASPDRPRGPSETDVLELPDGRTMTRKEAEQLLQTGERKRKESRFADLDGALEEEEDDLFGDLG